MFQVYPIFSNIDAISGWRILCRLSWALSAWHPALEPFNQVGQARKVEMTLPTKCAVETSEGETASECHIHDGPSQAPNKKRIYRLLSRVFLQGYNYFLVLGF